MRKRLDILIPALAILTSIAIGATVKQMSNLHQFNAGEVSGLLEARTDFAKYDSAARTLQNMIVRSQGPAQRRPGLKWVATVKDSTDETRIIPFEYSTSDSYIIELGDQYARFFRNGGAVLDANSAIYEIVTPWDSNDLFELQYAQDAQYMRVVHPNYAPYKITRTDHDAWTCTKISFQGGPYLDDNTDANLPITPSDTIGSLALSSTGSGIWDANHVGALWRLTQRTDGNSVTGQFTTTTWHLKDAGAADQNSTELFVWKYQDYMVSMAGFWVGTLIIQRSYDDKATWENVYSYTKGVQTEPGLVYTGTETEDDCYYRVQMQGLIGYRPHRNDYYLKFTYRLTALPFMRNGEVLITAVTDDNDCIATAVTQLSNVRTTTRWAEGAWSTYRGWPRTIEHHEQRCLYGGSRSWPQTIWASVVATQDSEYDDFDEGRPGEPVADDAWVYTLPGMNPIQWLRSAAYLMVGTTKAIGRLGTETESITPLVSPPYRTQAKNGSAYIQPVDAVDALLYVERGGEKVRELQYTYSSDRFIAPDMTLLAEHITGNGLVDMDFQNRPDPILWAIREDGYALSFTYEQKQEVLAWARHNTGQDVNDWNDVHLFESVAVIPGSGTTPSGDAWIEDAVYFVVNRTIDGNDYRLIEVMTPMDWGTDEDWAWFVDGGLASGGSGLTTGTSTPYTGEYPTLQTLDPNTVSPKPTAPTETALSGETDISDKAGLQAITGNNHYKLTADIDCSGAWTPITDFNGVLDGQGYTISNLSINSPGSDDQALFGTVGGGCEIRDVNITDFNVVGNDYVAALIARHKGPNDLYLRNITIDDSSVDAEGIYAGMLIATAHDLTEGDIRNCDVNGCTINADEGSVGALAGELEMDSTVVTDINIVDCNVTTMDVNSMEPGTVGGLIGFVQGGSSGYGNEVPFVIHTCSTDADITVDANSAAAGIDGVGGLIGRVSIWCEVTRSNATGSISITSTGLTGLQAVGGFVGFNDPGSAGGADFNDCYATVPIDIDAAGDMDVKLTGGFLGKYDSSEYDSILRCYATGDINIVGLDDFTTYGAIGGFIGGMIFGGGPGGDVRRCWADGSISINDADLPDSNWKGGIGGFMGLIYANVTVTPDVNVIDNYAWGSITLGADTTSDLRIGGLVGSIARSSTNTATIIMTNAYDAQTDTAAGSGYTDQLPVDPVDNTYSQGCIGYVEAGMTVTETSYFWDTETSGVGDGNDAYADGNITTWMQTRANYIAAGWDFNDIWQLAQDPIPDTNNWQGMTHLVNTAACVYADGIPRGSFTVDANGQLNLGAVYTNVVAGLNYYSIYESLPLVNSQTQGKVTMLMDVVVDFYETMGAHVGTSYTLSSDLLFSYDSWATGITPYTGFKGPVPLLAGTGRDPTIYIWEWDPLPMTIRSINTTQEVTMP